MKEYFIQYSIVVIGSLSAFWINSIIFCLFKADKYEDVLAKKISKEVNKKED